MKCNTKFWDFRKTFIPDIEKVGVDSLEDICEKEWDQVAVRSFLAPFLEKTYRFDTLEEFMILSDFLTFSDSYVIYFDKHLIWDNPTFDKTGRRIPTTKTGGWVCEIFYDDFALERDDFCLQIFYYLENQKIKIEFARQEIDDPDFPDDFPDLMRNFLEFCENNHANG